MNIYGVQFSLGGKAAVINVSAPSIESAKKAVCNLSSFDLLRFWIKSQVKFDSVYSTNPTGDSDITVSSTIYRG